MKKLLSLLIACLTAIAIQAQIISCHIDGPANVRQQPNTKSPVMGSIKNRMVAKVSHISGNMWKIHEVYNPQGGQAYTGKVIGYYTHKQNLIFDMGGNATSSSSNTYHSSRSNSNTSYKSDTRSDNPNIYSADSFVSAAASARIYNEEGGRLYIKYNGLWIEGTMVSGAAPKVVSFNSAGGVLQYQMIDSKTITLMIDFSSKMVMGNISGSRNNMFFNIK